MDNRNIPEVLVEMRRLMDTAGTLEPERIEWLLKTLEITYGTDNAIIPLIVICAAAVAEKPGEVVPVYRVPPSAVLVPMDKMEVARMITDVALFLVAPKPRPNIIVPNMNMRIDA